MVVDLAAKKKAREERLQAKRDMINAQQADFGGAEATPEPAAEAVESEVKDK